MSECTKQTESLYRISLLRKSIIDILFGMLKEPPVLTLDDITEGLREAIRKDDEAKYE